MSATLQEAKRPTFADVVEAADSLSVEEQEELVAIVQRRLVEAARERLVRDVDEGREEFEAGQLKAMSVDEIVARAKA